MNKQTLLELVQPKRDLWKKSFDDVRMRLLTIGFSGSGSSLIGYLLTAHANMAVADEPSINNCKDPVASNINDINGIDLQDIGCLYSADLNKIFNVILDLDYVRWLVAKKRKPSKENKTAFFARGGRKKRYILVPDQYQGRFEKLKVLGIKRALGNLKSLSNKDIFTTFKKRLEEKGICLKFILAVRNPYDMIANKTNKTIQYKDSRQKPITTNAISFYEKLSEENIKLVEQVASQDIFVSKHEEMVADPSLQLTKLCQFAQVSASSDYLDSCTSWVVREPNRRRLEFDWTSEQKEKVASLIEQYDFFSGYSWEL